MWSFHSIPMYFVALAILFAVVATPAFKAADAPPSEKSGRVSSLDGLRGVLALSVFFYHALLTRQFSATGQWHQNASHFYDALGPGAVAMFFMITGYLFWSKVLKEQGPSSIGNSWSGGSSGLPQPMAWRSLGFCSGRRSRLTSY